MNSGSVVLLGLAAFFGAGLAATVLFGRNFTFARTCFAAGMLLLAAEAVCGAASLTSDSAAEARPWQYAMFALKSFVPAVWLAFALAYSRANYRAQLRSARALLVSAAALPVVACIAIALGDVVVLDPEAVGGSVSVRLGPLAKLLNMALIAGSVAILTNLERTFRAAVGTMQWRIKFLTLGLAVIFGVRIYTRTQTILFSSFEFGQIALEGGALILGCIFIAVGYARTGFSEVEVYPSRAVLHTSFTILLVGGYLFVVGGLAQLVAARGDYANFQLHAFFVLVAVAALAVLLLSDRLRQRMQALVSRHFRRPEHDFREVWTAFTQALSAAADEKKIVAAAARSISSTFGALSVSIWLFNERRDGMRRVVSTSASQADEVAPVIELDAPADVAVPAEDVVDLEKCREPWAAPLRVQAASEFATGGDRLCLHLATRKQWLGVAVLADRVGASPYTAEERDLLRCIGEQIASALLNARLTDEIVRGREIEAFRTMSAFFVHDLKNVASTLTLTLRNLPIHFDNPEFREDALRGIGKTVARINELISRLASVRHQLEISPMRLDLNQLVDETVRNTPLPGDVLVRLEGEPLPPIMGDREQLQSVVTNLLLNAADAINQRGEVVVQKSRRSDCAAISVIDRGCGMSNAFVRDALFRPFQSTKKNGLGIGMFQSQMIIEAHGGSIQVQSEVGAGTTFCVLLPILSANGATSSP